MSINEKTPHANQNDHGEPAGKHASRPGNSAPPDEILQSVVAHIRENGLAGASLRKLAAAAGTSHRLLIYYFGSRDAVLGAVMRELRHEESSDLSLSASTRRQLMEQAWDHFSDDRRVLEMRLFFYLAGHAVHDPENETAFQDSVVSIWTDGLVRLGVEEGLDEHVARLDARVLVDASRGLFLDRLLTEDPAVEEAFRHLLDAVLPS